MGTAAAGSSDAGRPGRFPCVGRLPRHCSPRRLLMSELGVQMSVQMLLDREGVHFLRCKTMALRLTGIDISGMANTNLCNGGCFLALHAELNTTTMCYCSSASQ